MYKDAYRKKLTTPEKAVSAIRDNDLLIFGVALAEPPALLSAVSARLSAGDLKKLRLFYLYPLPNACKTVLKPELCDRVEAFSSFVSEGERGLVRVGLNQFVPCHFHQIPGIIRKSFPPDVCITTVSPMDAAGFFSFGTANDFTSTAALTAKKLIVEVNQAMPRVFGRSMVHVSRVHAIVENHAPLYPYKPPPMGEVDRQIGKIVAEMVPDGATIQIGAGGVPKAVATFLSGHRDLGIHSELMIPDMVELIKTGVVTGRKKTLMPEKHVFTMSGGGPQAMRDFMNDNPAVESHPVDWVNDPAVIARNDNMVSINAILEVDLLGQANAEAIDGQQFSGTGGQLDFVRGAYASKGGKSILAFHSTARKGKVSRVVPRLGENAIVTTPRQDVHWLVTEHGAADLKGKSLGQRALAIIELAHPDFREGLLREAEKMRLL
ncbi:MAG: acetyl-CoA hydrolase/transferase C-terminal domain-containing protein [Thermodesulfobacteriota bacterium]